jgi:hypothetical protein
MMDKILIKDRLYLVDYQNQTLATLYSSQGQVEGGAFSIEILEDVAGWYDLSFSMPAYIMNEFGKGPNMLAKQVAPLSKIKYESEVMVNGVPKIEELYFIVQPAKESRDSSGVIKLEYSAIDYPRHILGKMKHGLTITSEILDGELSLNKDNELTDIEGFAYFVPYPDSSLWDPTTGSYPDFNLDLESYDFPYEDPTKVSFYWDIDFSNSPTGELRHEGVLYKKGDRLLYSVYRGLSYAYPDNYKGAFPNLEVLLSDSTGYNEGDVVYILHTSSVWSYSGGIWVDTELNESSLFTTKEELTGDWMRLPGFRPVLGPNNAENYLKYVLRGTEWGIGTVDYVEVDTGDVHLDEQGLMQPVRKEKITEINIEDGNVYNAISEIATVFELYPRFDHTNKKVSLLREPGSDNNLTFTYRENLEGVEIVKDGEKTITKLYVYGGESPDGLITLGDYSRRNPEKYKGSFTNDQDLLQTHGAQFEATDLDFAEVEASGNFSAFLPSPFTIANFASGDLPVGSLVLTEVDQTVYRCFRNTSDLLVEDDYASMNETVTWSLKLKKLIRSNEHPPVVGVDGFVVDDEGYPEGTGRTVSLWGNGAIPNLNRIDDLPLTGEEGEAYRVKETGTIYVWHERYYDIINPPLPGIDGETGGWHDTNFMDIPTNNLAWEIAYDLSYGDVSWAPEFATLEDLLNDSVKKPLQIARVLSSQLVYACMPQNLLKLNSLYIYSRLRGHPLGRWYNVGEFREYYEDISPMFTNYMCDFTYFLERGMISTEQVEDIKKNYLLKISRLNKKINPLLMSKFFLQQEVVESRVSYDTSVIARDAAIKAMSTTYHIYSGESPDSFIETIEALPPGSTMSNVGWVEIDNIPQGSFVREFSTYQDMKDSIPNPSIGDIGVLVSGEIYVYSDIIKYEDTITYYLGWPENEVTDPLNVDNYLRHYQSGNNTYARVGQQGLYESYRGELNGTAGLDVWFNPPKNILEAAPLLPDGMSSVGVAYFNRISNLIDLRVQVKNFYNKLISAEQSLGLVTKRLDLLTKSSSNLELELAEKYSDFIIEGSYSNEEIVFAPELWREGMRAMELYRSPIVSYSIGVIDISGLPEYRTNTSEIYHDIVYRLSKLEQILPQPGDTVYITDLTLGLFKMKAKISSITYNITNPTLNKINIQTAESNTEDMISNLITAANVIAEKERIFNRASIITKNFTLPTDVLSESMDTPNADVVIVGRGGALRMDNESLTATNPDNPHKLMKFNGRGLFTSDNFGESWKSVITDNKISIQSLSAGSIDANTISLVNSGANTNIAFDWQGITASRKEAGLPVTTFKLDSRTGDAFFKGEVSAASGNIGGWNIEPGRLSSGSGSSFTAMSTVGSGTSGFRFWAGNDNASSAPFSVTELGALKANSGTIGGWTLSANTISFGSTTVLSGSDGSITTSALNASGGGIIGGFTIGQSSLTAGSGTTRVGVGTGADSSNFAFWAGNSTPGSAPFRVTRAGTLTATSATFTGANVSITGNAVIGNVVVNGTIDAASGTISGASITGGQINIGSGNFQVTSAGKVSFQNDKIFINPNDSLTINDVTFAGAGLRISSGSFIAAQHNLPNSSGWSGGISDRIPFMTNIGSQWLLYVKKGIVVGYQPN